MSKYIIEADERSELIQVISVMPNGTVYTNEKSIDELEELTADYVNEHFGILQDDAYNAGFENGKKEAESSEAIEQAKADAFNKGMLFKEEKVHDAFLRGVEKGKVVHEKGCDGCKYAEMGPDTTICAECCNAYHNKWTAKDTYYDIIRNSIHNWVTELNVKLEDISKVLEDIKHD